MTDHSVNAPQGGALRSRPRRVSRAEFTVYFSLIFLLALPFAALGWTVALVRDRRMPERNAVARAWCEARQITPMIFLV